METCLDNNILFEAYAINMDGTAHEYARLPLPLREVYEEALKFAESNNGSMSDHLATLPFLQQKTLERTVEAINKDSHIWSFIGLTSMSVVVALRKHFHHRRESGLRRLKTFFSLKTPKLRGGWVRIILMRYFLDRKLKEIEDTETTAEEGEGKKDLVQETVVDHLKETVELAANEKDLSKEAAAAAALPMTTPPSTEQKAPVTFKDAVGRTFSFPFWSCHTWEVCLISY